MRRNRGDGKKGEAKCPEYVRKRIQRGEQRLSDIRPKRELALRFLAGDQYARITSQGVYVDDLSRSSTDFAPWQERRVGNLLFDIYRREVSAGLSRVPGYDIRRTSTDPEDEAGARVSQRVAEWGYDEWKIRKHTEKCIGHCVSAAEAFAWPYFNPDAGPYIAEGLREGKVELRTYNGNQVTWEPGVDYEDSQWWAFAMVRSAEDVMQSKGYIGPGNLKGNATTSDVINSEQRPSGNELVVVVDYFERPREGYEDGRWITTVGEHQVFEEQTFPRYEVDPENYEGDAPGRITVDGPPAYRLAYSERPDSERGMSLLEHLIDSQRAYNNSVNRTIEWIKLALNPQAVEKDGRVREPLTPKPGTKYTFEGSGDLVWKDAPQIPPDLAGMREFAQSEMGRIAAQNDIPSGMESGKAYATFVERDQQARAAFLANLADWHAQVMTGCLNLVAVHFTTPKLISLRGRLGWEPIENFRAAMMRAQVNVRVEPDSIEPRSREAQRQLIMNLVQINPGAWPKELIAQAMQEGDLDVLVEDASRDRAKINRLIQQLRRGGESVLEMDQSPDGMNPLTGEPYEPDWMPGPSDNVGIWLYTLGSWMKTPDFEDLDQQARDIAEYIYVTLKQREQGEQMQQAVMTAQTAAGLGSRNAASPQMGQMPSLPALGAGEQAA